MARRRLTFCRICGHLEWVGLEDLAADYRCPLCGANRNACCDVDDERHRGQLRVDELIPGRVWRLRKSPPYPKAYEHSSYALAVGGRLVLYDAPPVPPDDASIARLRSLGQPLALVVSHADFVGFAELWRTALDVDVWMGDDEPLPGNRVAVPHRVRDRAVLPDVPGVVVTPAPGHSPGSIALVATSPRVLFAGDAVTVDDVGRRLALPQEQHTAVDERVRALLEEAARDAELLCMCLGALAHPGPALRRLAQCAQPCARPWRGEAGGAPLDDDELGRLAR